MLKNMSAAGIRACRHCRIPVLDNDREDKAWMTRSETCSLKFAVLGPVASKSFKNFWAPIETDRPTVHFRRESQNSNSYCAQTNRYKKMVDRPK